MQKIIVSFFLFTAFLYANNPRYIIPIFRQTMDSFSLFRRFPLERMRFDKNPHIDRLKRERIRVAIEEELTRAAVTFDNETKDTVYITDPFEKELHMLRSLLVKHEEGRVIPISIDENTAIFIADILQIAPQQFLEPPINAEVTMEGGVAGFNREYNFRYTFPSDKLEELVEESIKILRESPSAADVLPPLFRTSMDSNYLVDDSFAEHMAGGDILAEVVRRESNLPVLTFDDTAKEVAYISEQHEREIWLLSSILHENRDNPSSNPIIVEENAVILIADILGIELHQFLDPPYNASLVHQRIDAGFNRVYSFRYSFPGDQLSQLVNRCINFLKANHQ